MKYFFILFLCFFIACSSEQDKPPSSTSQKIGHKIQRKNDCLKSTVVEKPFDEKTEPAQDFSEQYFDSHAYYNLLCPHFTVILKCRCTYFNSLPTQWIAIKGFTQRPEIKEEIKTMLLEVCKSHNKSFTIHSCLN